MSSNLTLQSLWPAMQALLPTSLYQARLTKRLRHRACCAIISRETTTDASPFGQTLLSSFERMLAWHKLLGRRVTVAVELGGEPHPRHEMLLLHVAGALVNDVITHSHLQNALGKVQVQAGRFGAEFRLIIEDDGWQPRSAASWLTDNAAVKALISQAGGRVRYEVNWATNRAIVVLPF